jgi:pentatricopeptide repeat protein
LISEKSTASRLASANGDLILKINLGKVENAFLAFINMKEHGLKPNATTYNVLMTGLLKHKRLEKSLSLYVEMLQEGVHPTQTMQSHLMAACAENPVLMKVLALCQEMQKTEVSFNQIILEANPGVKTFNSLINAFAKTNNFAKVVAIFEEMQKMGIKTNALTYKATINAYVKLNDVNNALLMTNQMFSQKLLGSSEVLQQLYEGWIKDKSNLDAYKAFFQRLHNVNFQPNPSTNTYATDCHAFTKGAGCLFVGIHLDILKSEFTFWVTTSNPTTMEPNESLKAALYYFVKENYPSCEMYENSDKTGVFIINKSLG